MANGDLKFVCSMEIVKFPCSNCYHLQLRIVLGKRLGFDETYDLIMRSSANQTARFQFNCKVMPMLYSLTPCDIYPRDGPRGCQCSHCCLELYLQTYAYSTVLNMDKSNKDYKYYNALMFIHGPHFHYLLLAKIKRNKLFFIMFFNWLCNIVQETQYADYLCDLLLNFAISCRYLTDIHIKWLLSDAGVRKHVIYFVNNLKAKEPEEDLTSYLIYHFMFKIYGYMENHSKYRKFLKGTNKNFGMQPIWEDDEEKDLEYKKNMKECGNKKCKRKYEHLYVCKGCKLMYFCSRKCQKYCWNRLNHKYHCNELQKFLYPV